MPEVSIIVPVYNKELYIKNCIERILNQSYKNFELIIIDDGSTDEGKFIVDKFSSDDRVKVVHQSNQGVSCARNTGLNLAKGRWIWFIDADDIPHFEWLQIATTKYSNYDIIFTNYKIINSNDDEKTINSIFYGEINKRELSHIFMKTQFENGFFGYLWCKLIKRDFILKSHAIFNANLTLAEDLSFMIDLYKNDPKCFFLNDVSMTYRIDSLNSSKIKPINYIDQLNVIFKIYNWICIENKLKEYDSFFKKKLFYYIAYIFFYGFETKNNIKEEILWLNSNSAITEYCKTDKINNLISIIGYLAVNKRYKCLHFILGLRKLIRKIYRILKGANNG